MSFLYLLRSPNLGVSFVLYFSFTLTYTPSVSLFEFLSSKCIPNLAMFSISTATLWLSLPSSLPCVLSGPPIWSLCKMPECVRSGD